MEVKAAGSSEICEEIAKNPARARSLFLLFTFCGVILHKTDADPAVNLF